MLNPGQYHSYPPLLTYARWGCPWGQEGAKQLLNTNRCSWQRVSYGTVPFSDRTPDNGIAKRFHERWRNPPVSFFFFRAEPAAPPQPAHDQRQPRARPALGNRVWFHPRLPLPVLVPILPNHEITRLPLNTLLQMRTPEKMQ